MTVAGGSEAIAADRRTLSICSADIGTRSASRDERVFGNFGELAS